MFHITHWKAGSQWVRGVLQRLVGGRLVVVNGEMSNVVDELLQPGAVYTPVYMPTQWFDKQITANPGHRCFVVIRDLRDAAVSWYFSIRFSHGLTSDFVAESRVKLNEMDIEAGLLQVVEQQVPVFANIQRSWLNRANSGVLLTRYEDLIADEHGQFNRIFDFAGLEPDPEKRRVAIEAESFQKRTGRKPGEEKVDAHHRKGVAGDWQNHFTDRLKDVFKEKFGQVLIDTGYETDLNW